MPTTYFRYPDIFPVIWAFCANNAFAIILDFIKIVKSKSVISLWQIGPMPETTIGQAEL